MTNLVYDLFEFHFAGPCERHHVNGGFFCFLQFLALFIAHLNAVGHTEPKQSEARKVWSETEVCRTANPIFPELYVTLLNYRPQLRFSFRCILTVISFYTLCKTAEFSRCDCQTKRSNSAKY